jgi:type II secretory pathway pseudopilin PulG
MIEMMVVLAIVVILAGLAAISLQRSRPRANLATISTELHALLRGARQNAMATGNNTIVLVLPNFQNPRGGIGRVQVFEDPTATFFQTTAAPSFETYDVTTGRADADSEILQTLDFPRGLRFSTGATGVLPLPYADINVATACGFCSGALDGRGAIQYDSRGRATFHSANGAPLDLWGSSLSLQALDPGGVAAVAAQGTRTLVLTAGTGSVRSITGG